jgi:hypothetical protein
MVIQITRRRTANERLFMSPRLSRVRHRLMLNLVPFT